MKISKKLHDSRFFKLAQRLFVDDNLKVFDKSWILAISSRLTNQWLSLTALIASVACLLYRSLLVGTVFDKYNVWFLLLVLALATCNKKAINAYRSTLFLIGFIIFGAVSAVFSAVNGTSATVLINGILLSAIFPLFFIIASTYSKKYYKVLPMIILLICLPLLLAGIWQFVSGMTTPQYWVSPTESLIKLRIYGWSDNPNNLGAIAMLSGLVATFTFLMRKRWYYIIYAIFAAVVTTMTFSRASWIGWILALAIVLITKNWRYIFLSAIGLLGLLVPSVRQRLFATVDPLFLRNSMLDGRIWTSGSIMDIFRHSPLLGIGPGTYGNSVARDYISPAYNMLSQNGYVASYMVDMQWQQILCQHGIVGILFVAGFFVSYYVNMLRQYVKGKNFVCLTSVAILSVMLVTGFLENVWFFAPLSGLYGVILGSGQGYANNK